jgi:hypothetical protein
MEPGFVEEIIILCVNSGIEKSNSYGRYCQNSGKNCANPILLMERAQKRLKFISFPSDYY